MSGPLGDPPLKPAPDPGSILPPEPPLADDPPMVPVSAQSFEPAPVLVPSVAPATPTPPPPPARPVSDPSVPSSRRLIGASFDLLSSSSDEMRRASFYIGSIVAGTAGGYAVALWAVEVTGIHSTTTEVQQAMSGPLGGWMALLGLIAVLGLIVASVESRAMAAAVLGGRSSGRPIGVRAALARSRATFWRVVTVSIIVTLVVGAAQGAMTLILGAVIPNATELSFGVIALVAALVGAPFAYLLTGVVLGDVGPIEATRRSFRVFRARKGAAVLVALFESLAQLLILLGLSAGLDIVLRVFSGLGLSVDSGAAGIVLGMLLIAIGVFAVGTLVFTVTALSIAPQVVMFVALTHATFGLDHVRPGGDRDPDVRITGRRRFRRFTRPMLLGFVFSVLGALGALTVLPG